MSRLPDPTCRGAAWVRPITALDVWRHLYATQLLASSRALLPQIVGAQPPAPTAQPPAPEPSSHATAPAPAAAPAAPQPAIGSNAIAIGRRGTRDHRGLLLANPHFPWHGSERFYQAQLTIPVGSTWRVCRCSVTR